MSENNPTPTPQRQQLDKIRHLMERSAPAFAQVCSRYMDPKRLLKVGLAAFSRQPDLLDCTPQSLLLAFLQAAELGLEPCSAKKEAYLIPFRNKNLGGRKEALFLPSYMGLATIARRSGEIVDIEARVVYERDVFLPDYGENKLVHRPDLDADRGEIIASWARAWFKGGHTKFEIVARVDIDKIRASSRGAASEDSPWRHWYDQMCAKSSVRRLYKLLPKSDEMGLAEDVDDGEDAPAERYAELMQFSANVIELDAPASRTSEVRNQIKKTKQRTETPPSDSAPPRSDSDAPMSDAEKTAIEAAERARNEEDK